MRTLRVAKAVILISLISLGCLAHAAFEIIPKLDCGEYLIQGKLTQNQNGDFLVRIRESSSSPFEFLVLGGDFDQKLEHLDSVVTIRAKVFKKIESNNQPFVELLGYGTKLSDKSTPYKLVSRSKCEKI
jgi:hypothetical protein